MAVDELAQRANRHVSRGRGQKRAQLRGGLGGMRFLERMTTRHLLTRDACGLFAPDRERVVAHRDRAALAPKHEQGALNLSAEIGAIVLLLGAQVIAEYERIGYEPIDHAPKPMKAEVAQP